MKKRARKRSQKNVSFANADSGMMEIFTNIKMRLISIENKIDGLTTNRSSIEPKEKYAKRFRSNHKDWRNDNFRERTFFKAICADCRKECGVPFKPSQDRPVYCKECFAKRKDGRNATGNKPDRKFRKSSRDHKRITKRVPRKKKPSSRKGK